MLMNCCSSGVKEEDFPDFLDNGRGFNEVIWLWGLVSLIEECSGCGLAIEEVWLGVVLVVDFLRFGAVVEVAVVVVVVWKASLCFGSSSGLDLRCT